MNRLDRIVRIDAQERLAVVEPGVINLDVSKAAAPYGLYYAPDPSSQPICTIGGNLAFNSGGAHCLKYGMTSNHVLGLKVVLPEGEVVSLGRDPLEGTGPDLVGLFVGSEGLFGIALEVTLRLLPKPQAFKTILAAYHSLELAGETVARVVGPACCPVLSRSWTTWRSRPQRLPCTPVTPWMRKPCSSSNSMVTSVTVEADFVFLQEIIAASGAYEVRIAKDDADRMRIWKGRKSAFSAVGRLSPDYIVQDGVVPRSRLSEALSRIQSLSAEWGSASPTSSTPATATCTP